MVCWLGGQRGENELAGLSEKPLGVSCFFWKALSLDASVACILQIGFKHWPKVVITCHKCPFIRWFS